jgi:hypothetical protein
MSSCLCRFKHVSLVSKRFRQLCLEPELLREVKVDISGAQLLPRSRAFLQFLIVQAQHVRRLTLGITPPDGADELAKIELNALAVACLSSCATVGKLESMTVLTQTQLGSHAWLPALLKLTYLALNNSKQDVVLPAGMSRLTALQSLWVAGNLAEFDPPPSLTYLHFPGHTGASAPEGVVEAGHGCGS